MYIYMSVGCNCQYFRHEEVRSLHPELESALDSLHANIITHSPRLMPLFKTLHQQVLVDKTRGVMEKARLVGRVNSLQKTSNNHHNSSNSINSRNVVREAAGQGQLGRGFNDSYGLGATNSGVSEMKHDERDRPPSSMGASRSVSSGRSAPGSARVNPHIDPARKINFEALKKRAHL
jgi:hypothetical protein